MIIWYPPPSLFFPLSTPSSTIYPKHRGLTNALLFFIGSSLSNKTVTMMGVRQQEWEWHCKRPSRSGIRGIDISQRYVFPIRGPIFCSFSHCTSFSVVINHSSFVFSFLDLLWTLRCAKHEYWITAATLWCHLRFMSSISDVNLWCFFITFVLVRAVWFERICFYPPFTSESVGTGTGKSPWHKRAKRAVACSGLACQREKRACVRRLRAPRDM